MVGCVGHTHPFCGATHPVEWRKERHAHRIMGRTGEAIPLRSGHFHEFCVRTEYADGHIHEFCGRTGMDITLGGVHTHLADGWTSNANDHKHRASFSTRSEHMNDES